MESLNPLIEISNPFAANYKEASILAISAK